jgi:hypothetical protein
MADTSVEVKVSEIFWEGVELLNLAQDEDNLRDPVNTVASPLCPFNGAVGVFLSS